MKLDGIDGIHLTMLKKFTFPDPVFKPGNLKGGLFKKNDYKFLSESKHINKKINTMSKTEIKELGIMKPIKNINVPQDQFWKEFVLTPPSIKLAQRDPLPLYPFQIFLDKLNIKADRESLKSALGCNVLDHKITAQIRIYPSGIGIIHLTLHIRVKDLEDKGLVNLVSNLKQIELSYKKKKRKNPIIIFQPIVNITSKSLLKDSTIPKLISGHYLIINLQGDIKDPLIPEKIFKQIMMKKGKRISTIDKYQIKGRYNPRGKPSDGIFLSKTMSVLFIDAGLRDKHKNTEYKRYMRKGRRCFRSHFINSIEIAYILNSMANMYKEEFQKVLAQIHIAEADQHPKTSLKKIKTINVLNQCAYLTIFENFKLITDNTKWNWRTDIFNRSSELFNLKREFSELYEVMGQLYDKEYQWNCLSDATKKVYTEFKSIFPKLSPLGIP